MKTQSRPEHSKKGADQKILKRRPKHDRSIKNTFGNEGESNKSGLKNGTKVDQSF